MFSKTVLAILLFTSSLLVAANPLPEKRAAEPGNIVDLVDHKCYVPKPAGGVAEARGLEVRCVSSAN
ncbi:hypothetical protein SISSUDRAFT_1062294 [Sistotremastrum suecicum HHB10207 ss-3]|uniref:Uncharacterized protein n=1 Tax=Sistotremastrum suecicum HHB10207 ss-3 TaxID=1314776 RepID=A0A166D3D4_9AGAM|nr:hypothetical protein SISSUDRAFT_1062294 [Sistotremastrum suecicum HHB10207 ss-3]